MKILINDPDDLKKKGVYCIKNIINNKIYVGSTCISFRRRVQCHLALFKQKRHHNVYLSYVVKNEGIDIFEFSILEIIEGDKSLIREREKHYIDTLKSLSTENGYNLTNNTTSPPITDEIREKMSLRVRERYKDPIFAAKMKKCGFQKGQPTWNLGLKCDNISNTRKEIFDDIEVYDLNMVFFRKFDNPVEIEKFSRSNENDLPIPDQIPFIGRNAHTVDNTRISYKKITNKIITRQNIYRAIRNNKHYKGLFFKKIPRTPKI